MWYGVRTVFRWGDPPAYEERVLIWRAESLDDAIEQAEQEARAYTDDLGHEYLGLAQAYLIGDDVPESGDEVYCCCVPPS